MYRVRCDDARISLRTLNNWFTTEMAAQAYAVGCSGMYDGKRFWVEPVPAEQIHANVN